jgi:hypothetical protein
LRGSARLVVADAFAEVEFFAVDYDAGGPNSINFLAEFLLTVLLGLSS